MRVIFDGNLPEHLDEFFPDHQCGHVIRLGWVGIRNGNLIRKAEEEGFQVLLTLDQGILTQQNLTQRKISIVVLKPDGQGVRAIEKLATQILAGLKDILKAKFGSSPTA